MRILTLLLISGTLFSQVTGFPAWASADPTWTLSGSSGYTSVVWNYLHPALAAGSTRGHVMRVEMGAFELSAVSTQSVVAIRALAPTPLDLAGLEIGLFAITDLSGPHEVQIAGTSITFALATGVAYSSLSEIKAIVLTFDTAGHPQFSLLPIPVVGLGSELFIATGVVDGVLYVMDGGPSPKLLRFLDMDANHVWETRDPAFSYDFSQDYEMFDGNRYPGYVHGISFPRTPNGIVSLLYSENLTSRGDELVTLGGTGGGSGSGVPGQLSLFSHTALEFTDPSAQLPWPVMGALGRQDRVLVCGKAGLSYVLEAAVSSNGPWSPISAPASATEDFELHYLTCGRLLVANEYIRLVDLVGGQRGLIRKVGPIAPNIFSPRGFTSLSSPHVLTLLGDNLDLPMEAHFYSPRVDLANQISIAITSQLKYSCSLDLSTLGGPPRNGVLVVTDTTSGKAILSLNVTLE